MNRAPVALFVYNRPWHAKQTVEALQRNALATESELFVFSDAPKSPDAAPAVHEVRGYISRIGGFRSVHIVERDRNMGLAGSIIEGVSRLSNSHGRVIVLEDDMVTSPHFLAYMNAALDRYADDDRVISIHGYVYPSPRPLPEAFFLRGADCWGWATWRRGWATFNSDGQFLLDELKRRKLGYMFDFNGAYPYVRMLQGQIQGHNDSWAVRWYASAFLADKLTLYPGRSLVRNIGNDSSGMHCGESATYHAEVSATPIDLSRVQVAPSVEARAAFEAFFRQSERGFLNNALQRIKRVARKLAP